MRKTICKDCGEEFIEEHEPENTRCDDCWIKFENGELITQDDE